MQTEQFMQSLCSSMNLCSVRRSASLLISCFLLSSTLRSSVLCISHNSSLENVQSSGGFLNSGCANCSILSACWAVWIKSKFVKRASPRRHLLWSLEGTHYGLCVVCMETLMLSSWDEWRVVADLVSLEDFR